MMKYEHWSRSERHDGLHLKRRWLPNYRRRWATSLILPTVTSRFLRRILGTACILAGVSTRLFRADRPARCPSSTSELVTSYADWRAGTAGGVELIAIDLDAAQRQLARFESLVAAHGRRRGHAGGARGTASAGDRLRAGARRRRIEAARRRRRPAGRVGVPVQSARMRRRTTSIARGSSRRCRCSKEGIDSTAPARSRRPRPRALPRRAAAGCSRAASPRNSSAPPPRC